MNITYVTEDPSPQYAKDIRAAMNRSELVRAIEKYKEVADDALAQAKNLTDAEFTQFQADIKKASRPKVAPKWAEEFNRTFGAIAMPMKMLVCSLVAMEFHAPWGTAYIRCKEQKWSILDKRP